MWSMEQISFGSDPEFIILDSNGSPKSAIGILGKKGKDSSGLFYDNVLAECEVEPSDSRDGAVESVGKSLKALADAVRPLRLSSFSSCTFPESEMWHKDARVAGCSPEMCAYKLATVPASKAKKIFKKSNFRTAGGHVHIGTALGGYYEESVMLVRMLDLFVGVAELIMDRCPHSQARRRLYGAAGRYRQPSHGVEYRTPGNFWLQSPRTVELFFDMCQMVVGFVQEGLHRRFWSIDKKMLDSEDFWNSGGDPATCHSCHGYDQLLLRRMFCMKREDALREGGEIVRFSMSMMDTSIKTRIVEQESRNMYQNWGVR